MSGPAQIGAAESSAAGLTALCRACGHAELWLVRSQLPDFFLGSGVTVDHAACARCGLVQAHDNISDISSLYRNYPVHRERGPLVHAIRKRVMGRAYHRVPPPRPKARLLDYGCGDGAFLDDMRRLGWLASGVEFDGAHARALSQRLGLEVRAADAALDDWRGRFDLITLQFVFEHLDEPRTALASLVPLLRPGGQLFLSVPNLESRESRLFGRSWFDLDPPRHRSFFTRGHFPRFLESLGLERVEIETTSCATSFAGSLEKLLLQRFSPALFPLLLAPAIAWAALVRDSCLLVSARAPDVRG